MIQNAVVKPYDTSKIIVLPIEEKIECQINKDRRELDSLFITNKYDHPGCVVYKCTILIPSQNDASKCKRMM